MTTSKAGIKFTAEEIAEALKLVSEGIHVNEVAVRLGRRAAAVRHHTRSVRSQVRPPLWTQEESRRAIEMSRMGAAYKAIGEELGRTEKGVESHLRSAGELRATGLDEETRREMHDAKGMKDFVASLAKYHPNGPPSVILAPTRGVPFRARSLSA